MPRGSMDTARAIEAVGARIDAMDRVAVAVSGGIDSLTLATLAARRLGERAAMFHSQTGSVPVEATRRTRELAARLGWSLHVIDAREFTREDYLANPVNRCFHCKTSLYAEIAGHTDAQILSGANTDDLGEYRPGLDAAREAGVRHPFVEAGVDKRAIRAMARDLGLGGLAEIPASPCLSSRVETGIRIQVPMLQRIDAVEMEIRKLVDAKAVRCRVRAAGIVIELDAEALEAIPREEISRRVAEVFGVRPSFEPYRSGSAFLT
jgi:pyridinium-3,5-biscarboxylic acid mononucleotide sulfurtransferase